MSAPNHTLLKLLAIGLAFSALPALSDAATAPVKTAISRSPTTVTPAATTLGITPPPAQRLENIPLSQNSAIVRIIGDVNHDGYPDLFVGMPTYSGPTTQEGSVDIYYGTPTGFSTTPSFHYQTGVTYGFIGSSPVMADVNGDGYDDLIVGGYNYTAAGGTAYTGAVFVFFGSANGLATTPSQILTGVAGTNSNSFFGNSIRKMGDFNHDGYADIAVSSQGLTGGGAVQIFTGGPNGLNATPQTVIHAPSGVTNFGGIFDTGDTNGDGYYDVIVSRPGGKGLTGGSVYIFQGSATGPATAPSETITDKTYSNDFGGGLAFLGDVNGDGYGDLAVGAPTTIVSGVYTGAVHVFYGSAAGYTGSTLPKSYIEGVAGSQAGFGGSLKGGRDFNRDGYNELVVGPDFNGRPTDASTPFPGFIWVYKGGPNGIDGTTLLQLNGTAGSWEALGFQALDVFDVNNDGHTDVLSAAPTGYAVTNLTNVRIYYGLDRH